MNNNEEYCKFSENIQV